MIKLSALETAMYMAALLKGHTLEVRNDKYNIWFLIEKAPNVLWNNFEFEYILRDGIKLPKRFEEVRNTIIEASKMEDWHISRIFKD